VARFGEVVTAMVTPFHPSGSLDLDAAAAVARHLAGTGSDGLVVAGSTGEGSVLSDEEKLDLFRAVAEAVTVPVVAATGSNDTAHTVNLTRSASECGVDGVLVVTPYYNRPSPAGLAAHFEAAAAATRLPVVLYDIPVRSGRRIGTDLLVRLATEVPNIVGVKDATGDVAGTAELAAAHVDGFEVYAGDDALTLPVLAVGGVGVISVASHWAGRTFSALVSAFGSGNHRGAQEANERLLESYAFESTPEYPNPVPAKAACRAMGLPVGQCRLPNAEAPTSLDLEARRVIDRLHGHVTAGASVV
jgi:4-hydroxy-tetrahydrodipicolinate synthase